MIGSVENTANANLVILGDFTSAAIDWNTMDVASNLASESFFVE